MLDRGDEDLAVADLPGPGGRRDRLDHAFGVVGGDGDLDLDLRQEVHRVFGAAIDLGVALLAAVAFHFGDGEAADAELRERIANRVELEWLDDRNNELHDFIPRDTGAHDTGKGMEN